MWLFESHGDTVNVNGEAVGVPRLRDGHRLGSQQNCWRHNPDLGNHGDTVNVNGEIVMEEKRKGGRTRGSKNLVTGVTKVEIASFFSELTASNYRWRQRVEAGPRRRRGCP